MRMYCKGVLCAVISATGMFANAAELNFSGYLSAIGGAADDVPLVPYAGYSDDDFTFDNDSLVGVQAVANISDRVSVTAQLVARGDNGWQVEADWAYVSLQFTDSWKVRAGRFRVPFYLFSDFVTVGYAYPWIRPPVENYSLPFDNISGIDTIFTTTAGSADLLFQAYFGSTDFNIVGGALNGSPGETNNQFGLVGELTWGDFKFRLAHHQADVTIDVTALYSTLPAAINPYNPTSALSVFFPDNANRMLYIDDLVVFQNAGVQWDNGRFLIIVERNWLDADDEAPAAFQNRFYATAGVRFGDFLVHYTWAERDDDVATLSQGMPTTGPFAGVTAGVNAVAATLPQISEQSTIGLRWDFTTATAFKIEYLMQKDSKPSNPHEVNVLRFGVQTVF